MFNRFRRGTDTAPTLALSKYAGQSSGPDPENPFPGTTWSWPVWTSADLDRCGHGKHESTRQRVVLGHLPDGVRVEHFYCACGRWRWMKYNGSFVETTDTGSPGAHEQWVDGHEEMASTMKGQR